MFFTSTEVIGISWLSGRLCSLSGVRRAVPAVPGEAGLGRWELEDLTGQISNLQMGKHVRTHLGLRRLSSKWWTPLSWKCFARVLTAKPMMTVAMMMTTVTMMMIGK